MNEKAFLVLSDGTVYPGRSFGVPPLTVRELTPSHGSVLTGGEVVFNTGMCGYHEIITDPSYTGQIVVMTYPHIGNYGFDAAWSEDNVHEKAASSPIQVSGLVVRKGYNGPVPKNRMTIDEYFRKSNKTGISDIDTRRLTLQLRDRGSQNGVIVRSLTDGNYPDKNELKDILALLASIPSMVGRNLVDKVGVQEAVSLETDLSRFRVALIDCGTKANIVRELKKRGCDIVLYPSKTPSEEILAGKPDGVLISNGPGDPAVLDGNIRQAAGLIGRLPLFGICLGHQIISLAIGGKSVKMKFGHHGVNHPVRDELTGRVIVTSQNHGFMIDEKSLPADAEVWFRNANDHSLEGIKLRSLACMSVQFHPEAAPGPADSGWIFDEFVNCMSRRTPDRRR